MKKNENDVVIVAASFPQRILQMAMALENEGRLKAFVAGYVFDYTGLVERICSFIDKCGNTKLTELLKKRSMEFIKKEHFRCIPMAEVYAFVRRNTPFYNKRYTINNDVRRLAAIDHFAADCVIDESVKYVVAREDGALASFNKINAFGGRKIYELPIAYYKTAHKIMTLEEDEFPNISLEVAMASQIEPKRIERKEREIYLADRIVVPSDFVRQSLVDNRVDPRKIIVLPSACNISWRPPTPRIATNKTNGCLVLHVGCMSLRKGTHRLLRVWKKLKAYRTNKLRIIGKNYLSDIFLRDYKGIFEYIDRLPWEQLRNHFLSADFFVLPSAVEGFAAVILEAISTGLPVVVSRNSGAEGFIEHKKHCLLHEYNDEEELGSQIDWMLSNPDKRNEMSLQMWLKAGEWTWHDYRARFSDILKIDS